MRDTVARLSLIDFPLCYIWHCVLPPASGPTEVKGGDTASPGKNTMMNICRFGVRLDYSCELSSYSPYTIVKNHTIRTQPCISANSPVQRFFNCLSLERKHGPSGA
jgi:hypothetical protein